MIRSRLFRSATLVVGVSKRDMEGTMAAVKRAVGMASSGDKIVALHVPTVAPEMMLSSMSDPSDCDDETFDMMAGVSKDDEETSQKLKDLAAAEMKEAGKELDVSYKVTPPAMDAKTDLLAACKAEKAKLLFVGPGSSGKGEVAAYAVAQAKGFSVVVCRDEE